MRVSPKSPPSHGRPSRFPVSGRDMATSKTCAEVAQRGGIPTEEESNECDADESDQAVHPDLRGRPRPRVLRRGHLVRREQGEGGRRASGKDAVQAGAARRLEGDSLGDDTKGAYGTMTRFAPGTNNPLYSHQNDLKLVVIEGAYIYGTENGETRLGRGSYVLIPGGKQHTSRADGDTLFFEESVGKFTFDPVKKP